MNRVEESGLPRFLCKAPIHRSGERAQLAADEVQHLRSRRVRTGDRLVVLDGRGGRGEGVLESEDGIVLVDRVFQGAGESISRVTLLLGAAEPARIEWAVEKGTECGVSHFVLVDAERSQAGHVRQLQGKLERLKRIAAEAMKQCNRSIIPEISGPHPLPAALQMAAGELLLASPGGLPLPRESREGPFTLAVGPEGGFAPAEETLFREAGATLFSLGPRILRVETAVVAALSRLVDPG